MDQKYETYTILFFDGLCNLCNRSVDFVIRKNKKRDIHFASLQSDFAKEFLKMHNVSSTDLDTMIYYTEGKFYFKSTAVLKMTKKLNGGYKLLPAFLIVPKIIRDGIYSWVAKNRYRFFGKRDTCRVVTAGEKLLFID